MPRRWLIASLAVLAGGLLFRFAIVSAYSSSSPDGDQYFALAQTLIATGRYAFSRGAPLTFSRLPGYPLVLALLVDHLALTPHALHVTRATELNTLLDAGSALLIAALLREWGISRAASLLALAALLLCPLHFLFASYALTESLATLLTLLALWLAVRAMRRRLYLHAALAGLAAGAGMLVRADLITIAPALFVALLFAGAPLRKRLTACALCLALGLCALAPWMARNLARFGAPHLTAAEWPGASGEPLPTGPVAWMRTWADGAPGDGDVAGLIYFGRPLSPSLITPKMVDSAAERAQLTDLFAAYDRERLSPSVDAGFRALASARTARHPLRTFVTLPLARLVALYRPPPSGDYPLRVGFLDLPRSRAALFGAWNGSTLLLALGGFTLLLLSGERRRLAWLFAIAIGSRTALHLFAVPMYVCQRYLIEVYPLLLGLAAIALVESAAWIRARRAP